MLYKLKALKRMSTRKRRVPLVVDTTKSLAKVDRVSHRSLAYKWYINYQLKNRGTAKLEALVC